MSEERDMRACGIDQADLIDLVRGEFDGESGAARREEIERHVGDCPDCRADSESLRSVREAVRSVEIAPSSGFHGKLMARVREAAREDPEKTPAPANGVRLPGGASRRLAHFVERENILHAWFRPRWKMLVLATSAAACFGLIALSKAWILKPPAGQTAEEVRLAARHAERIEVFARFRERRECAEPVAAELDGSWLDLADMDVGIIEDDQVVLTGVIDLSQDENCLMAFRAADWEEFARGHERAPEGAVRERFRAIADSRQVVPVRGGRIEIPREFLARHVSGTDVIILRLRGRMEIWSRENLKAYMRHGVPGQIGVEIDEISLSTPAQRARRS